VIPLHPRMPSGCEFAGTLGEMTFWEIVELHPLAGSEFRDAATTVEAKLLTLRRAGSRLFARYQLPTGQAPGDG
jgi:hypothetical protein